MTDMKEEIKKLFDFETNWCSEPTRNDFVEISEKDGRITIEVSAMYGRPTMIGTLLDTLQAISRITGKPEVSEGEDIYQRGCETCDYFSRYGFTFHAFDK